MKYFFNKTIVKKLDNKKWQPTANYNQKFVGRRKNNWFYHNFKLILFKKSEKVFVEGRVLQIAGAHSGHIIEDGKMNREKIIRKPYFTFM